MKNNMNLLKKVMYTTLIIIFIILFIYISFIIYYLNNLVKCECYENKDLKYLIYCEYALLVLAFINSIVVYLIINDSIKNSNYLFMIPILSLILNIYIIYATIKIYKNINIKCSCSMSTIRYMLYIQAIIMFISCIVLIVKIIQNKNLTIQYNNIIKSKKNYNNITSYKFKKMNETINYLLCYNIVRKSRFPIDTFLFLSIFFKIYLIEFFYAITIYKK